MKVLAILILALATSAQVTAQSYKTKPAPKPVYKKQKAEPKVIVVEPKIKKVTPPPLPKSKKHVVLPPSPKAKKHVAPPTKIVIVQGPSPSPFPSPSPSPVVIVPVAPAPSPEAATIPKPNPEITSIPEVTLIPIEEPCTDVPPDAEYTCAEQASFGRCDASFMMGFCDLSCDKCP